MRLQGALQHHIRVSLFEFGHRYLSSLANLMETFSSTQNCSSQENMRSYCMQDRLEEALLAAECVYAQGFLISKDDFYTLLQACCRSKNLAAGRQVLTLMVKCRLEASAFLGYHLICLFASCGKVEEAYRLFNMILHPNEHTFHAIMLACARAGEPKRIFELFYKMQEVGLKPDKFVFSSMLNCCDSLGGVEQGKLIHDQIIRCGLQSHLILGNTLIDMYSKCRYLDEASKVFDSMPMRDVVSWGSLLGGFAEHGKFAFVFTTYEKMQQQGINPSNVTFLCILKACNSRSALEEGKWIHVEILKSGIEQDVRVGSALVGMYSKCRRLDEARQIFESLPNRDVVAWGAIITGYAQHGPPASAFDLFELMKVKRVKPDITCFSSSLSACGKLGTSRRGKLIHCEILERGLERIAVVGGALVDMYAHCGSLEDAHKVFETCPSKDVVSYGAMISGYVQNGQGISALHVYTKMQKQGVGPNKFVFSCSLKACSILGALMEGAHIHDQVVRAALETDVIVGSAIVDMYVKCASIMEACKVFEKLQKRDLVSWGAMIVGFVQCGHGYQAYDLFKKMQHEGMEPDSYVFTGTLKACGIMDALKEGMHIHSQILETGHELDTAVGSALVDMYIKCRSIDESTWVFEKMPSRNIEAWGAIIAGFTLFGHGHDTLSFFNRMLQDSFKPDLFIFLLILKSCGYNGDEAEGKLVHGLIMESSLESDILVGNSLVDMYCKCGRLEDAHCEFNKLKSPDSLSWGAMVTGYCLYDQWVSALELFKGMQENGIKSNKVTLLSLLKACGNVGAIGQGILIHQQIVKSSFESDTLLGSGLLDMYAKCGSLDEAHKVFENLSEKDVVSWSALIAGYALHGNCRMVGQCFKGFRLQGLKPNDVIFTSLLTACSHVGLVNSAGLYFKSMVEDYGMLPSIEQYSCMIDLFGRMGCLSEADDLLQTMAVTPDFIMCTSLLNSCQRHGSLGVGRWCFDELVRLTPSDASGYVGISNLYADASQVWITVDT